MRYWLVVCDQTGLVHDSYLFRWTAERVAGRMNSYAFGCGLRSRFHVEKEES